MKIILPCPVLMHFTTARSPIYSHLSATLQGLPVIRSFSMQSVALDQFHKYQNQHSQAWYLYLITTRYYLMHNPSYYRMHNCDGYLFLYRWFGLRIDILNGMFITLVTFSSVPLAACEHINSTSFSSHPLTNCMCMYWSITV